MSHKTNNGAGNGSGDDDGPLTDEKFYAKHGRHSRMVYAMSESDAATLRAAANVLNDKLVAEMIKHSDCGDDPGACAIYDPEIAAGLMDMTRKLRLLADARDEAQKMDADGIDQVFIGVDSDDDDIPDFVKQAVADFAAHVGGSGAAVRVARMRNGGRSRNRMNDFIGHRHNPAKKEGFDA